MPHYLGVDGGGSKTAFAVIDDAGRVLGRTTTAPSYYFDKGIDVVEQVLAQGVAEVCRQAGVDTAQIASAFFGIPGYGEASGDTEQLDAVPYRVLGHHRYRCDNDMVCGWAGSLAGEDGINVIAGTGSMAYGERLGSTCRVGGWGELFGDEGSAYWVAAQGLNAFSRMSDGRCSRGPLYDLFKQRLRIDSDLDSVSLIIDRWDGNRGSIAALATTVSEGARHGDEICAGILDRAAAELAALVETSRVRLGFGEQDRVPVSYSGGMFSEAGFLGRFHDAVARLHTAYSVRAPLLDPTLGAALYAAKVGGNPLTGACLDRLAASRP